MVYHFTKKYNGFSLEDEKQLLRLNLQFFADEGGDKTEEPTAKKLSDARKEGQVARSTELVTGASLLTLFLVIKLFSGYMGSKFMEGFVVNYNYIGLYSEENFNYNTMTGILAEAAKIMLFAALPVLIAAFVVGLVVNMVQVKWEPTAKPLMPKLSRLNPVAGFKRMFSLDKVLELLKAIIKIGIIVYICYSTLIDRWELILELYEYNLMHGLGIILELITDLGIKISVLFVVLGFADLLYQKYKFKKDLRMTKQEVKDEFKQQEGDPQVKGKIKSKMQEVSRRRMMQSVPEADVVITNPTHLAVALRYDREKEEAPVVVAKGADYLAEKIKEVARENNVEIVENKPLARMLYHNVEIMSQIPPQLYQMVAEVLAEVYKIKNKVN